MRLVHGKLIKSGSISQAYNFDLENELIIASSHDSLVILNNKLQIIESIVFKSKILCFLLHKVLDDHHLFIVTNDYFLYHLVHITNTNNSKFQPSFFLNPFNNFDIKQFNINLRNLGLLYRYNLKPSVKKRIAEYPSINFEKDVLFIYLFNNCYISLSMAPKTINTNRSDLIATSTANTSSNTANNKHIKVFKDPEFHPFYQFQVLHFSCNYYNDKIRIATLFNQSKNNSFYLSLDYYNQPSRHQSKLIKLNDLCSLIKWYKNGLICAGNGLVQYIDCINFTKCLFNIKSVIEKPTLIYLCINDSFLVGFQCFKLFHFQLLNLDKKEPSIELLREINILTIPSCLVIFSTDDNCSSFFLGSQNSNNMLYKNSVLVAQTPGFGNTDDLDLKMGINNRQVSYCGSNLLSGAKFVMLYKGIDLCPQIIYHLTFSNSATSSASTEKISRLFYIGTKYLLLCLFDCNLLMDLKGYLVSKNKVYKKGISIFADEMIQVTRKFIVNLKSGEQLEMEELIIDCLVDYSNEVIYLLCCFKLIIVKISKNNNQFTIIGELKLKREYKLIREWKEFIVLASSRRIYKQKKDDLLINTTAVDVQDVEIISDKDNGIVDCISFNDNLLVSLQSGEIRLYNISNNNTSNNNTSNDNNNNTSNDNTSNTSNTSSSKNNQFVNFKVLGKINLPMCRFSKWNNNIILNSNSIYILKQIRNNNNNNNNKIEISQTNYDKVDYIASGKDYLVILKDMELHLFLINHELNNKFNANVNELKDKLIHFVNWEPRTQDLYCLAKQNNLMGGKIIKYKVDGDIIEQTVPENQSLLKIMLFDECLLISALYTNTIITSNIKQLGMLYLVSKNDLKILDSMEFNQIVSCFCKRNDKDELFVGAGRELALIKIVKNSKLELKKKEKRFVFITDCKYDQNMLVCADYAEAIKIFDKNMNFITKDYRSKSIRCISIISMHYIIGTDFEGLIYFWNYLEGTLVLLETYWINDVPISFIPRPWFEGFEFPVVLFSTKSGAFHYFSVLADENATSLTKVYKELTSNEKEYIIFIIIMINYSCFIYESTQLIKAITWDEEKKELYFDEKTEFTIANSAF